jgi:hypothetical protein
MDLEEPLRAIDALLRDGKIRYWGVSNFRGWRIAEMVHLARQMNMPGPVVCQPYYNLLNRQPEVEVLPVCAHHGIGVVPYSPVARGVLTGKYAPGRPPPGRTPAPARSDRRMMETEFREEPACGAGAGRALPRARAWRWLHFATAWVLANRSVSAVIAGPRTLAQWQDYPVRWTAPSTPTTKPWSTAWWRPATRPRRATTTRPTRSTGAEGGAGESAAPGTPPRRPAPGHQRPQAGCAPPTAQRA